jgi:hypothetical protein
MFFPLIRRIFWHIPHTFVVPQNLAAHPWFVAQLVFVLSREQSMELLRYPYLLPWWSSLRLAANRIKGSNPCHR